MEIICISCWRAFEHDTSTAAAQVTCPHCSFSQPGPDPASLDAKLDANTRPSEVQPADAPMAAAASDETTPELTPPAPAATTPPAPAATTPDLTPPSAPAQPVMETAEFDAAPKTTPSPPPTPSPAPAPDAEAVPPKPDHRWRLRTPSLVVLFFPDYEALSRYLTGDEGDGYAIACGPGPFRTLSGFTGAMRVTDDPLEALVNVPPAEGEDTPMPTTTPRPRSGARRPTISTPQPQPGTNTPQPKQASDGEERAAGGRARPRRRRATATADFTFRKAQAQNVWPGRLLLLVLGVAAGAAVIYYVAWIGLLPGIVY